MKKKEQYDHWFWLYHFQFVNLNLYKMNRNETKHTKTYAMDKCCDGTMKLQQSSSIDTVHLIIADN